MSFFESLESKRSLRSPKPTRAFVGWMLVLGGLALAAAPACGSSDTTGGYSGTGSTGSTGSGTTGSSASGRTGTSSGGTTGSGTTGTVGVSGTVGQTGSGATGSVSGSTGSTSGAGTTGTGVTGSGTTGSGMTGATGSATGTATGSSTGATGTSTDAGAGDGGPIPTPTALTCGSISIAAKDVLSDFDPTVSMTPITYAVGNHGGSKWYSYGQDDSGSTLGATTPGSGSNAFTIDSTVTSPCGKNGALKVSSTGNSGYGVGFGVNFRPDVPGMMGTKQTYSATAEGYTGVGFWMKCSAETQFVFFKIPDAANDAAIPNPSCQYSAAPYCNQYGIKNNIIPVNSDGSWNYYPIYFSETLQDPSTNPPYGSGVDATKLTGLQIQVNSKYGMQGASQTMPNGFTCWVADVHFLTTPAPAPITTSSGYTVSGNKIQDSSGATHIFKGLGRPSLEWDKSGFGITREDFQRMKAWGSKVNVVRISLNEAFYVQGASGFNQLYAKYVDRAVQWALQQGLDVILDLHWGATNGSYGQLAGPDSVSTTFWTSLATKYKGNGRVIFELFNEPQTTDASTWASQMQPLYTAVRNAGASNLVVLGGLDWAYNVGGIVGKVSGTNIAYATHPYIFKANDVGGVDDNVAFINPSKTVPLIATEFGDATISSHTTSCSASTFSTQLSQFSSNGIGFTGYAWYEGDCGYPSMIKDYSGTPSTVGTAVKAALQ